MCKCITDHDNPEIVKHQKSPSIRFRGFTDSWEQREFEKSFSLLQNNTLSRADLSESPGFAVNIHYGDVLIKFGEYLDMLQETFPWIQKQADADKFRTSFLQDGDVVFADTAEDETAGKCCEIGNCGSIVIISGLHTIPCRPVSKFAPGYLGYCLNSAAFHEQLVPLMQGTKVVSISKAALKSTLIQYPSDDKEQQKIGALFRGIDRLITLHQRE
jgi:type I restriction enzyme S subunit